MRSAECGIEGDRMLAFLTVTSLALQGSVADTSPFRALPLPAPGRVRSASGAPGPDYWQQRVDYVIRATLDTSSQTIRGRERIHYVNHSPDTLAFLWVQIEQNLFAPNSITYALSQPPLHFAGGAVFDFTGKGFTGGITIERFAAGGRSLKRTEYGTMMRVELARPLPPRGAIDCDVAWHFPIPPYGGGRMGRIGTRLYEIGQWYPRLVVYDDVHGWNPLPYIGAGEFYLEYGDFDVTLTLPAGFLVAATGTVANPLAVWTAGHRARRTAHRRHQDLAPHRAERPRRRVGRVFGLSVGCVRLARHPDSDLLPAGCGAVGRREQDGVVHDQALQRDVGDIPVAACDDSRRAGRRHGVSDAHVRPIDREARGPVLGSDPRVRARMVPDDGWLRRAALPVDGRGLQHVHRLRLGRRLLQGDGVRGHGAARPAQRRSHLGGPRQRAAAHRQAGRAARSRVGGLSETRADADGAARRGARQGDVRARHARVRAPLDVPASPARRFLPHDRERVGQRSRLVLARVGVQHRPARPGGGLSERGGRHHAHLPVESRSDGAAGDAGAALCRWDGGDAGLSDRDVEPGQQIHCASPDEQAGRGCGDRSSQGLSGHRPDEQPLGAVSLESQGAWIDAPGLGGPPPLEEPPSDPTDARIAAIAAPPAPRATAVFHAETRFCLSSPIWLRGMVTSEPALKYSVAVSERKRRPATTSESGSA